MTGDDGWTVLGMLRRRLADAEQLGGICEIDAEELRAAIAAWNTRAPNLPLSDDVVERLRQGLRQPDENMMCLVDFEDLAEAVRAIAAIPSAGGVEEPTDVMIEAGCEAMHKIHAAMRDRNLSDEPETMDDFDEGDVCRAVYHAMRRAALGGGQ